MTTGQTGAPPMIITINYLFANSNTENFKGIIDIIWSTSFVLSTGACSDHLLVRDVCQQENTFRLITCSWDMLLFLLLGDRCRQAGLRVHWPRTTAGKGGAVWTAMTDNSPSHLFQVKNWTCKNMHILCCCLVAACESSWDCSRVFNILRSVQSFFCSFHFHKHAWFFS